jgi:hypothetical protein
MNDFLMILIFVYYLQLQEKITEATKSCCIDNTAEKEKLEEQRKEVYQKLRQVSFSIILDG